MYSCFISHLSILHIYIVIVILDFMSSYYLKDILCSVGFLDQKRRRKRWQNKMSWGRMKSGYTITYANTWHLPFGEILCWILLKKTALSLKILKKISSSIPRSSRNSLDFQLCFSKLWLKKLVLLKKLSRNALLRESKAKKIIKSSGKSYFAIIS